MASLDEQVTQTAQTEMQISDLSPLNPSIKGIYTPYALDQFITAEKVFYDNAFYMFAPEEYRSYLWYVEQRNLFWFRGYFPGLHNRGIISAKLGTRVCKRLGELTMSGGFRVEGFEAGEKFLEKYIKDNKIKSKLNKIAPMLNATGRCLATLGFRADNGLSMNFLESTKYFARVDEEGDIQHYIALVAYISPEEIKALGSNERKGNEGYYLIEQRKMYGTKCYQRYVLYKAPGYMIQPIFGLQSEVKKPTKRVFDIVRSKLGARELGAIYELPFKNHIGAVVILNSQASSFISENGFSDSSIADAHTALAQFDITNTQKDGNKYLAQTGVLIPEIMIPPEIANNPSGNVQGNYLRNQEQLDKRIYKQVPYLDGKGEQKPIFYQAENQSSIYNEDLKEIEAMIATLCGMTPTALAGNLNSNGDRTATEVLNEDAITRTTVEMKRDLIAEPMTRMFRWVLEHYEIKDMGAASNDIDMVFNNSVLNNPKAETEDIIQQLNSGIMAKRTAISRKNKNYNQSEIDKELKEIKEDEQSRQAQQWTGF